MTKPPQIESSSIFWDADAIKKDYFWNADAIKNDEASQIESSSIFGMLTPSKDYFWNADAIKNDEASPNRILAYFGCWRHQKTIFGMLTPSVTVPASNPFHGTMHQPMATCLSCRITSASRQHVTTYITDLFHTLSSLLRGLQLVHTTMVSTFPDLYDFLNTPITDIPSSPAGSGDSTLPVLSPDEVDAIFSDEKNSVEQPQETAAENHPCLTFNHPMTPMTQNEDDIPPSRPGKRNTPPLEPPRTMKFPRATIATILTNKATSFTSDDPATATAALDSYSQAIINGLVAFRSCHNLHEARHQFSTLAPEAFFPPSLQAIFDFHRGLTSVSNLGQLLPILVFLNELPNFPSVGPTILAVEGNNGPMIEASWMWRSRLCPFVQCRCENQQRTSEARKEQRRDQTPATHWLYQTENMICDTLIMLLFQRQITGGQLANCDRCYRNSPPYDSISVVLERIRDYGYSKRHPAYKKTTITEGPFRIYIQKGLVTDIWYLHSCCRTGIPVRLFTPLRWTL